MFDFPSAPSNGQQVTAPNGAVYAWNGTSWAPVSIGLPAYAPLNAPVFTGDARAVTPAYGDNDTSIPTTAFVQSAVAPTANNAGRNLVMNGAFAVQQRGAGPWTVAGAQTADRWQLSFGGSDTNSVTIIALTDADRTAIGDESATSALQQVVTGSAVANSYSAMTQHVENVRRLGGRLVTVSFWARATAGTPRVGITLQQNFGSGGSPSAATQVSAGATAALSSTWTRYTISGTFLSTVGKTLGTNADHYSQLALWFSDVSNVGGNAIGQQSGTIQLYGAQLEIGTVATPFDAGGTPQQQLAACQRFYQTYSFSLGGYTGAGGGNQVVLPFPVQMRATPTMTPNFTTQTNCGSSQVAAWGNYGYQPYTIGTAAGHYQLTGSFTASADL